MSENTHHTRPERVIEPECHAQGLIWVGDTSQPETLQRLQHEFDAIGAIMPEFEVTGFDDFDRHYVNQYGYPAGITLYRHMWKEDGTEQHRQPANNIAFDQTPLRIRVPVNWHCSADLSMRYQQDGDTITPDWDASHQYFSVMQLNDLERDHLLTNDDEQREQSVVALIDHHSRLVIPLPYYAVVSWMYYGDGADVEISVYDGKSLRWQMDTYSEYFDANTLLNEDEVELDIANCLDCLERIQQGFINPRSITERDIPACAVQQHSKERKSNS